MRRLAVCCLLVVASCTRTPTDAGVDGQVLLGPTCPVQRVGEPCPDQPLGGAMLQIVTDPGGKEVSTLRADAAGRFKKALKPGNYRVRFVPEPGKPGMSGGDVGVTVTEHRFTSIIVSVDSGIR